MRNRPPSRLFLLVCATSCWCSFDSSAALRAGGGSLRSRNVATVDAPEEHRSHATERRLEDDDDDDDDAPTTIPRRSFRRATATISDAYDCYRDLEGTRTTLRSLAREHPSLVEIVDVGPTWLKTVGRGGDTVRVLKLTNRDSPMDEERRSHLFVVCALHARELATAEACARFAERLLDEHGENADATWILDRTVIHVVPQANPDGRADEEAALAAGDHGHYRRKNMHFDPATTDCGPSDGGVDLNRNWPHSAYGTVGVSDEPCDGVYPGTHAASEPEVAALVRYIESVVPPGTNVVLENGSYDPNTSTGVLIDVHSYGEEFFFPWGYKKTPPPNHVGLEALANEMADRTTPRYGTRNEVYSTAGDTTDWAYEQLGLAAFTIELGTKFYERCDYFKKSVLPSAWGALFYAARVAERPYLYPLGPEVTSVEVLSSFEGSTKTTTLAVRVEVGGGRRSTVDRATTTTTTTTTTTLVAEIRLYVDAHPSDRDAAPVASWRPDDATPTAAQRSPDDRSSSSTRTAAAFAVATTTTAVSTVDASGLDDGRHVIYARAFAADGTPGTVRASFFDVPLDHQDHDDDDDDDDERNCCSSDSTNRFASPSLRTYDHYHLSRGGGAHYILGYQILLGLVLSFASII